MSDIYFDFDEIMSKFCLLLERYIPCGPVNQNHQRRCTMQENEKAKQIEDELTDAITAIKPTLIKMHSLLMILVLLMI